MFWKKKKKVLLDKIPPYLTTGGVDIDRSLSDLPPSWKIVGMYWSWSQRLMHCDSFDVPTMVQALKYIPHNCTFEARFFDGSIRCFDGSYVADMGIDASMDATERDLQLAYLMIDHIAARDWTNWKAEEKEHYGQCS